MNDRDLAVQIAATIFKVLFDEIQTLQQQVQRLTAERDQPRAEPERHDQAQAELNELRKTIRRVLRDEVGLTESGGNWMSERGIAILDAQVVNHDYLDEDKW